MFGKITVVNKFKEPNHEYCGRGSALGNPFPMKDKSDRERNRVCELYEDWFYKKVSEPNFLNQVDNPQLFRNRQTKQLIKIFRKAVQGEDVNLGCFCTPKRCHCETVKTFIDNKLEEYLK